MEILRQSAWVAGEVGFQPLADGTELGNFQCRGRRGGAVVRETPGLAPPTCRQRRPAQQKRIIGHFHGQLDKPLEAALRDANLGGHCGQCGAGQVVPGTLIEANAPCHEVGQRTAFAFAAAPRCAAAGRSAARTNASPPRSARAPRASRIRARRALRARSSSHAFRRWWPSRSCPVSSKTSGTRMPCWAMSAFRAANWSGDSGAKTWYGWSMCGSVTVGADPSLANGRKGTQPGPLGPVLP